MKYRLFVLVHSSQQREERTKKRRRSYRAFRLVASVVVGVCGTRFAQTVLALFPPSSLRLRRPIKAELTSPFSGFIQLSFFNPSVTTCHLPYMAGATQGRSVRFSIFALLSFQPPRPTGTPPIFLTETPRNTTGHGRGRGLKEAFYVLA